jgi:hypothetical protein
VEYNAEADDMDIAPNANDDDAVTSAVVAVAAVNIEEASLPQRMLSPREFQTTLHFLLGFIKKDKQADGLYERLLLRLGLAQTSMQRRNLAYCISEVPASLKALKKLVELFKHIKDSLHDSQVRAYPKYDDDDVYLE